MFEYMFDYRSGTMNGQPCHEWLAKPLWDVGLIVKFYAERDMSKEFTCAKHARKLFLELTQGYYEVVVSSNW